MMLQAEKVAYVFERINNKEAMLSAQPTQLASYIFSTKGGSHKLEARCKSNLMETHMETKKIVMSLAKQFGSTGRDEVVIRTISCRIVMEVYNEINQFISSYKAAKFLERVEILVDVLQDDCKFYKELFTSEKNLTQEVK